MKKIWFYKDVVSNNYIANPMWDKEDAIAVEKVMASFFVRRRWCHCRMYNFV